MNQTASALMPTLMALPAQARDWLDGYGRKGWIAAAVLGVIFAWPVGLALVFYITLTRRWKENAMFGRSCRSRITAGRTTGNAAFDAYKEDTLKRLEDEQQAFEGFLKRLRDAKDKQEFDAFMQDRAERLTRETA